jgi:membrane protein
VIAGAIAGVIDRAKRALRHYTDRDGSTLAAAVTYFAFLSLFPLLALAFAAVGLIANVLPDAQGALDASLRALFPGMIGDRPGQMSLAEIREASGPVAGIGIVTVAYSGLSWIADMRDALGQMFDQAREPRPVGVRGRVASFAANQLRNAAALASIGTALLVSVAVSGGVLDLASHLPLVSVFAVVVGVATGAVMFFLMFRLLADPDLSVASLWSGALVGAIGFEILKRASTWLLDSTASQPAFQAFGIALILLVWIYYFSRVVMYAAAWARTDARGVGHPE